MADNATNAELMLRQSDGSWGRYEDSGNERSKVSAELAIAQAQVYATLAVADAILLAATTRTS